MIDAIKAKINDQKAYAAEQCARKMLEGSNLAVSSLGTVEQVEKITLEEVSDNIAYFLKNAVIECYYYGNDDVESVANMINDSLSAFGREKVAAFGEEYSFNRDANELREFEDTFDGDILREFLWANAASAPKDPLRYYLDGYRTSRVYWDNLIDLSNIDAVPDEIEVRYGFTVKRMTLRMRQPVIFSYISLHRTYIRP